jgi:NTE family protein
MNDEPIALLLAGGGARGAYEAGALTVLLPELERRGQRPDIVVGTSVGALNAAFVAATAHLPVGEVAQAATAIWSSIRYEQVLAPLVSPGSIGRLAGYLGEALGVPRARAWSVLDPSPLGRSLPELVDFAQLRRNVAGATVRTAAVVATSARTARSVVFHDGGRPDAAHDDKRGIDYVAGRLRLEHVLASSAIPALFPAVEVGDAWYTDGGTRLNTPIKPALALGARRVVVIGLNSLAPGDFAGRPDALAGAGTILQSLLADQLLHDARTLQTVNEIVVTAPGGEIAGRRAVPHVLVTPERPDTVGALARQVFLEHYSSLGDAVHHRDLAALGRAVAAGSDAAHGELLSYLFFAPEFARALLELGQADARRWLADSHDDGIWRVVA